MLIIQEVPGVSDVYDITVQNTHCFYGNNILVHNCTEITLPTVAMETKKSKIVKVKKEKSAEFLTDLPKGFSDPKKL